MRKRFINGAVLLVCTSLGACSGLPFVDREPVLAGIEEEGARGTPEATRRGALALPAQLPAVPVPPLKSGSQALFNRGIELLLEGKLDAAQVLFEELTAEQPELAGPWVNLGYIHLARDEAEQAQAAFTEGLTANPANCDALTQLGVMARRGGRFAEAEEYYLRCIAAQPLYANAHLNLGILYELYMGRLGDALAAYNDYQLMLPEPDNKVSGWVMDLQRRVAAIATR